MTTPILIFGFEDGVSTTTTNGGGLFDSITDAPTVQSSIKRTGAYALEVSPSGAAERCGKDFTGANIAVASFYVYFATLPSASCQLAFFVCTGDTDRGGLWYDQASGQFGAQFDGGGTRQTGGPTVAAGTWYLIDMRCTYGTNPRTLDWQIDGAVQTQATFATTASTCSGFRFGTAGTETYQCYYDDAVISVTTGDYPIGAHAVEVLTTTSDGTHNAGTNIMENQAGADIGAVTAFDLVDDIPITGASTYIKQLGNGTGNYAEMNFSNLGTAHTGIIGAKVILAYTSASTTTNSGGCIASKDSFSTNTPVHGVAGSLADYSDGGTSNLFYKSAIIAGVVDDTTADALQVRVGYSGDANPDPYWVNIIAEVAYTLASGTNFTRSIADSLGITDAITEITGFIRSLTTTEACTTTTAIVGTYIRTLTTTEAVSDSLSKLTSFLRSVANNIGITDILAVSKGVVVSLSDTLGITDTLSKIIALTRALADTLGITDSSTRIMSLNRSVSDSGGITDSTSKVGTYVRALADTTGITDVLLTIKIIARVVLDNLGITDSISNIRNILRAILESVGISDVITKITSYFRGISTTEGISDTLFRISSFVRTLANSVDISDILSRIVGGGGQNLLASISDSVGITDTISRAESIYRTLLDNEMYTDVLAKIASYVRSVISTESFTDSITRSLSIVIAISNSVGMSDQLLRYVAKVVQIIDTLSSIDTLTSLRVLVVYLTNTVGITDITSKTLSYIRSVTNSVGVTDSISKVQTLVRQLGDAVGITDYIRAAKNYVAFIGKRYFRGRINKIKVSTSSISVITILRGYVDKEERKKGSVIK